MLDSRATELVMSSEFARKQGFKLKKIENPIYIRNVNKTFNKEGPIENTMKVYLLSRTYGEDRNKYDWRTKVECDFRNAMACMLQSQD